MEKINLFDIDLDNVTLDEAVDLIEGACQSGEFAQVSFMNADCFNILHRDAAYRTAITESKMVFGDGIGVKLGAFFTGQAIRDNVNGTDLYPLLCQRAVKQGWRLFYLGATEESNARIVRNSLARFSGLQIAGRHHGYFSADDIPKILDLIEASQCDLLLVAFGAPRQELWIRDHRERLQNSVKVALGVGGLFDYVEPDQGEEGGIPRAPHWVRRIYMEWFYRMLQEPGRLWKRYLVGNPLYLWRLIRWKWRRQSLRYRN